MASIKTMKDMILDKLFASSIGLQVQNEIAQQERRNQLADELEQIRNEQESATKRYQELKPFDEKIAIAKKTLEELSQERFKVARELTDQANRLEHRRNRIERELRDSSSPLIDKFLDDLDRLRESVCSHGRKYVIVETGGLNRDTARRVAEVYDNGDQIEKFSTAYGNARKRADTLRLKPDQSATTLSAELEAIRESIVTPGDPHP